MQALVLDGEWAPREGYELSRDERESRRAEESNSIWRDPALSLEDRDRPEPAADEVLVKVRYAGVCGSDVAMIETDEEGYMHYSAYTALPNVLGHEFSGEVVETGADARLFDEGDLVTAEVTDYCGRCEMCRRGFRGHCENFEQLGLTVPGAFAEYVAVPEKLLWDVSALEDRYGSTDDLLRAAATVEPSTITYHGLFGRAEGIRPGDYYAFHGAGPIGLTGMNVARAAGAGAVLAFEPSDPRRRVARELGFDHVYDPTERPPAEAIDGVTGGAGVDVHVEAAGAVGQTYPVIEDTLAETANVVHISNAVEPAPVETRKYQASSAQIYGSEGHTGDRIYPLVIRLMAAGHLDNLDIVTATFDLGDAKAAVEQAKRRVDGKVLIEI
jgi:threonine dehydrogenase-like Zn-dependent dehydrogenase